MEWVKHNLIFKAEGNFNWMNSHSQGPTGLLLDDTLRIYFASRPKNDLTLPTFIDLDRYNFNDIVHLNQKPILELGKPGTFDEHGIIPKHAMVVNDKIHLYYIGWSRKSNTPYSLAIGLAISDDGLSFERYSQGPIIGIEKGDSYSMTAPCIFFEDGLYHMFYTSGIAWIRINGKFEHTYTIRKAISSDGIHWTRNFKNILEPSNELECISNPTIIKIGSGYHMWYSYKGSLDFRSGGDSYRIGYASSHNLENWERMDAKAGIDVSKDGWDSEMIEYPNIVTVDSKHFMFYNGNGFGASGFGFASLKV